MAKGIYVGLAKGLHRMVFRCDTEPTRESHSDFLAVIGPFRTIRGAKAMVHYGFMNPHMQFVRDAERIGKMKADKLKSLPLSHKVIG